MAEAAVATPETGSIPAPDLIQITPEMRASIAPHILETLPPEHQQQPADGDEEPEDEEEAPEAASEDDGAEPDAEAQVQFAKWVSDYDSNPASITSVPRAQQPMVAKAHREWEEASVAKAINDAYTQGQQDALSRNATQSEVGALDELFEAGNIALFRERVAKFPGGERAYYAAKANLTPVATGSADHFVQQAHELHGKFIREFPGATDQAKAAWEALRPPPTEVGVEAVRDMLSNLRAEIRYGAQRADPNQRKLDDRTAAAEKRKTLPKPDAAEGGMGVGSAPSKSELQARSANTPENIAWWADLDKRLGPVAVNKLLNGS